MKDKSPILAVLLLGLAVFLSVSYRPRSQEDLSFLEVKPDSFVPDYTVPIPPPPAPAAPSAPATPSIKEPIPPVATHAVPTETHAVPEVPHAIPAEPAVIPEHPEKLPIFSSGSTVSKCVALTFDDGPHPIYTPKVLDELRARNIKATFFVLGDRVKRYPWVLRQIVAEGHEVGNHSYSHPLLLKMSNEMIEHEIVETQNQICEAIGYETHLFRPPYGAFRPDTRALFRAHNLNIILWSVDPQDWKVHDSLKISNRVTAQSHNGSIILCHDIHKTTLQALPEILDTLIAEGYEFKTVSQLCGLPPLQIVTTARAEPAPLTPTP